MARIGRREAIGPDSAPDMRDPAEQPAEVAVPDSNIPAPMPPELLERVREAVESIPGDESGGAERIIEQLLSATSIDDLNAPWEGTSGRNLAGKRLSIRGVTQRPSSFNDGAGIFLVGDAVDVKTGDPATFTTSAVSVVLQLARCHQLGLFPVLAEVVVAERPTARGFYPYHLRILAAGQAKVSHG